MELSQPQRQELEAIARHGQPGYVRIKALALLNIADGQAVSVVAKGFRTTRASLHAWRRRYAEAGIAGLRVQAGRGRKSAVNLSELEGFLRSSPRQWGVEQTRWTLKALAHAVPSLRGLSVSGVYRVLVRAGYPYKRGQPRVGSPDPQYGGKKGLWRKR